MGSQEPHKQGGFRGFFRRLATSQAELEANELQQDLDRHGATPIVSCGGRRRFCVTGTLRTVTLRPRGGAPALEAELYDGSDVIDLIWLGRRKIAGIEPGRHGAGRRARQHAGWAQGDVQSPIRAASGGRCVSDRRSRSGEREDDHPHETTAHDTVEAAIRGQLAKAFGGVRGIIEAAVPTITFTGMWIATSDLKMSLIVSIAAAVVLLVVRVLQRSTPQFVINSLIGIGIGAFFASRTGGARTSSCRASSTTPATPWRCCSRSSPGGRWWAS